LCLIHTIPPQIMIYSQCIQLTYLNTWQSHISYMKQSLYVDWEPVQSLRTYPNNLGRGGGGGNAEKVILGLNHHILGAPQQLKDSLKIMLQSNIHIPQLGDKMDICDQKVISRSSDPTDQSLIQQQRKFQLFFFVQKILSQ
jgi:hypothetical protein